MCWLKPEIGHGRFLSCMGAVWHLECFCCNGCNQPISDYEFSMPKNYPYHKSCYEEHYHPKCDVCKNFGSLDQHSPWCNNHDGQARIGQRTDRILVNGDFQASLPQLNVTHLFGEFSDHSPLLLRMSSSSGGKGTFKFPKFWTEQKDFMQLLNDVWRVRIDGYRMYILRSRLLVLLKKALRQWNWKTVGDIFSEGLATSEMICSGSIFNCNKDGMFLCILSFNKPEMTLQIW